MSVVLSGCWDKVEIDQRGFVGIVALDMASPESTDESAGDESDEEKQDEEKIKVTYLFANPVVLAGGVSGGDKPAYTSLTSTGVTIDKANTNVDSIISRRLFFGFNQVVIFGEDFMKNTEKVKEALDYFRRSPEFSRSMRVLLAQGEASSIGETKPKGERLMSKYIRSILDNEVSNGRITDLTFNEFIVNAEGTGSSIIPLISIGKDNVIIAGMGIMKNYQIVGYLSEDEALYFNTMSGRRSGGSETVTAGNMTIDFTIRRMDREILLLNSDINNLSVGIHINVEGAVTTGEADREIFDSGIIKNIETELDKKDTERCAGVIKKLQKDYNADALKIGDYLKKFHPSIWEKIKDKWDEIYQSVKIIPTVNTKIRRVGTVK